MRRFPAAAFNLITAAVVCCGVLAGAGLALGATSASAGHRTAGAAAAIGSWGTAEEVPGTATLNVDKSATVTSVSCASAGNCTAGGTYIDSSDNTQAFVVSETGGTWGSAQAVPGITTLNTWISALNSVSCASAGNCAAGGFYTDSSGISHQAYVVSEADGTWGTAKEVPGTATLNAGGNAVVTSVSCASAGNCVAVGYYDANATHPSQAFVVSETGGTWGNAQAVPGLTGLDLWNFQVTSVSCPSAGNCTAGGYYQTASGSGPIQAFVLSETGGTWSNATEVPGSATLNAGGNAKINSVSCASAGNCTAGGYYTASSRSTQTQAFVANETSGTWSNATEVPGSATLNAGGNAQVKSVSCASAGDCTAGGYYTDSSSHLQAFVANETSGTWSNAAEVPGSATLNSGGSAQVGSVSCVSTGYCAAGGSYRDTSSQQAFLDATKTQSQSTSTSISLSTATVTYGDEQTEHVSVTVTSQSGTPGGTVTVKSGTTKVCTLTLASGKGTCTLTARQFAPGTPRLTASYGGSTDFAASTSAAKTLTVSKASSKTALALSAGTVTYGHEQSERLSVTVTPQYSGTPGGKVTIKRGTITVCTITLGSGKGNCTLTAKQLPVGTYTLVASYPGSGDFTASASAKKTLKVVK